MKTRDIIGKMKWLRLGIASLALAAGVFFSNGLTARAEENFPQNTTKETATPIALGEEVQTLSDYSHSQYFKFQTTEPGYLTVHYQHEAGTSTGNISTQLISIQNNNLNEYFYFANSKPEDTTAMVSPKVGVTPDTYYFFISGYQGPACKVTFKVDFTPCDNYEQEVNDKPAKANDLLFDKTMYAWITSVNRDKDYYRFNVDTPSTITLDINHESEEKSKWVVTIWDSNEKKIYETTFEGGQTRLDTITDLDLEPGTYYMCVGGNESRGIQGKTYDITAHCDSSARAQVRAFVSRLYRVALNRNPDPDGLTDWTNRLINGDAQAVNVVQGILGSNEYANMGKSNGEIVNDCYRAMLGRDAEEEGYNHWLVRLDNGMSMNAIFAGFVGSDEFKNLCATYGIQPGNYELSEARDQNYGVTAYVARLYTQALGREYDVAGLNDWCGRILANTSRENIVDVAATGFFHSQEFTEKDLNNEEYVKVLYRTFLGREAEPDGLADWVGQLDRGEKTRDEILPGFANSQEFTDIMAQYGL